MEFVDKSMSISPFNHDVVRYIHIGLLCVQKNIEERPTMASVVTMLSSDTILVSKPQKPGFYMERNLAMSTSTYGGKDPPNSNGMSVTLIEGR